MKSIFALAALLTIATCAYSQSGRRAREITIPVPPPPAEEPTSSSAPKTQKDDGPPVHAEKNEEYGCTGDGSLARLLNSDTGNERILTSKQVDIRVIITAKPAPAYTREARRNGVQGFVTLKVLLSGNGKVTRVRVVKGLPAGLTESAIRASCKMKFKPAMKDGGPVSQWVIAEYVFRLAESSIFGP